MLDAVLQVKNAETEQSSLKALTDLYLWRVGLTDDGLGRGVKIGKES